MLIGEGHSSSLLFEKKNWDPKEKVDEMAAERFAHLNASPSFFINPKMKPPVVVRFPPVSPIFMKQQEIKGSPIHVTSNMASFSMWQKEGSSQDGLDIRRELNREFSKAFGPGGMYRDSRLGMEEMRDRRVERMRRRLEVVSDAQRRADDFRMGLERRAEEEKKRRAKEREWKRITHLRKKEASILRRWALIVAKMMADGSDQGDELEVGRPLTNSFLAGLAFVQERAAEAEILLGPAPPASMLGDSGAPELAGAITPDGSQSCPRTAGAADGSAGTAASDGPAGAHNASQSIEEREPERTPRTLSFFNLLNAVVKLQKKGRKMMAARMAERRQQALNVIWYFVAMRFKSAPLHWKLTARLAKPYFDKYYDMVVLLGTGMQKCLEFATLWFPEKKGGAAKRLLIRASETAEINHKHAAFRGMTRVEVKVKSETSGEFTAAQETHNTYLLLRQVGDPVKAATNAWNFSFETAEEREERERAMHDRIVLVRKRKAAIITMQSWQRTLVAIR